MNSVDRTHMRHCLLYCIDCDISGAEEHEELFLTYKNEALSHVQCYNPFKKFKVDNHRPEDQERLDRLTAISHGELKTAIEEDP